MNFETFMEDQLFSVIFYLIITLIVYLITRKKYTQPENKKKIYIYTAIPFCLSILFFLYHLIEIYENTAFVKMISNNNFGAGILMIILSIGLCFYTYVKKDKYQEKFKSKLIFRTVIPLLMAISYFYSYNAEIKKEQEHLKIQQELKEKEEQKQREEELARKQKEKEEQERIKKQQEEKAKKAEEEKKKQEEAEKNMNEVEKVLSKQTQIRPLFSGSGVKIGNFARILASELTFSKYEHSEISNYITKLLKENSQKINYVIIELDGSKYFWTTMDEMLFEVEVDKSDSYSVQKTLDNFVLKDGKYTNDNGNILGQ